MNKINFTLILLWSVICPSISIAQDLNYFKFNSVDEMYSYFNYNANNLVISGHRGTFEHGLPENSIVAMEEVLKYTKAIFEVDPRLSKDSVAVMIHDNTLDRTTTGKGKVIDYMWEELQKLKLKDAKGNVTQYTIPTLDEMIIWAKGKTILNLDKKDLPLEKTAEIIRKHDAYAWVWVTVHDVGQAKFYLDKNPKQYLSMHIRSLGALEDFKNSGLPYDRMIVYVGAELTPENLAIIEFMKRKGVMCMVSTASTYDKLPIKEDRAEKYRSMFIGGATVLESDFPIEVSRSISIVKSSKKEKQL